MPKEYVKNRYFGQYAKDHHDCPGRDAPAGCPGGSTCKAVDVALDASVIKIGWSKEAEHVEIAVLPTYEDEHDSPRVWYAQFDRNGLNRLIRTLRKARDQAYGSDA